MLSRKLGANDTARQWRRWNERISTRAVLAAWPRPRSVDQPGTVRVDPVLEMRRDSTCRQILPEGTTMKLTEIARLLLVAKSAKTDAERNLALNALMVPLVKGYSAKNGADEQETMQVLLQMLWESE